MTNWGKFGTNADLQSAGDYFLFFLSKHSNAATGKPVLKGLSHGILKITVKLKET